MCDFNKMKWYFFYTPNYHFYKNHIINRISNHFDTKPLEIPQLKLANPDEKGHHFANITLKIAFIDTPVDNVPKEATSTLTLPSVISICFLISSLFLPLISPSI